MISPQSSIILSVGSFSLKYYSLTMLGAILCGCGLSCFLARKFYRNVSVERIFDILPMIVICAILGARLYYVLLDFEYYSKHLIEIFMIWNGGLSIHGALIGGFLGGLYCARKYSLPIWDYADVFSYGLLLGQAIGRVGNFFNIEAFGKPCSFSELICMYVPQYKRPLGYWDIEYYHPTFLYEAIWNIFVLGILYFFIRRCSDKVSGVVFFSYLALYSLGRLLIEHIRLDSVLNVGEWHVAEIVSVFVIVLSIIMIFVRFYQVGVLKFR